MNMSDDQILRHLNEVIERLIWDAPEPQDLGVIFDDAFWTMCIAAVRRRAHEATR